MRAIGRFAGELLGVFSSGVLGFFAMLLLAAGKGDYQSCYHDSRQAFLYPVSNGISW